MLLHPAWPPKGPSTGDGGTGLPSGSGAAQRPWGSGAGAGARAAGPAGWDWARWDGAAAHHGPASIRTVLATVLACVAEPHVSIRGVLTLLVPSHPASPFGEHASCPGLQLLPG